MGCSIVVRFTFVDKIHEVIRSRHVLWGIGDPLIVFFLQIDWLAEGSEDCLCLRLFNNYLYHV
jgi:hypothetical protein